MSDASDPRHANPDPAKRHQAAEVASGSPPMGSKPRPAPAPRREACHLCAGSLIVIHDDGGYGPCPNCDGGRPLEEAGEPPRAEWIDRARPAEHLRVAAGGAARLIATMTTTRRVAVDVEIEVAVWADDDSAPAAVQILGAMQRARVWLSEAIGRLPRPVGGGAGKDGAYSVRAMEVVNDDPRAPVHAEVADAANYLLARVQAALRDAADALAAEARAKRATLHADLFGDKLPARYEEIAARCRALVADAPPAAPARHDGPPPLQAGRAEGVDEAAARQMAELEANRKLRLAAEERALRAEERAAGALRDVDIWKRDATAQRERLAAAERAADEAGLELANRRRDWHEDRSKMLGILAELVPNVLVRADTESLTDIAHVIVGELGPVDRDAAVRWRHFRDLFEQVGTWSLATFGPGPRAEAILDHVAKEARECLAKPTDAEEWIDLAMLAMDGARRCAGIGTAAQWLRVLDDKHRKNQARTWPDWRTQDPAKAIEHDRAGEGRAGLDHVSSLDAALQDLPSLKVVLADYRFKMSKSREIGPQEVRWIAAAVDLLLARAMREGQP